MAGYLAETRLGGDRNRAPKFAEVALLECSDAEPHQQAPYTAEHMGARIAHMREVR